MKTLSRILICLFSLLPLLQVAGQSPQGLGQNIRAATAVPGGIVAITTDAKVLYSTDNWLTEPEEVFDLRDANLPNDNLYAIASRGSRVVVGGTDSLLYTADLSANPTTWTPKTAGSDDLIGEVRGLAASADDTWIAVGDGGILRSTDALAWSQVLDDPIVLTAVTLVSANTWVAVGTGGIWRSTNDGETWTSIHASGDFTAVASDGTGNVLAVGEMGTLVRSTDTGATFTALTGNGTDYRSVAATGAYTWVIGGVERTLLVLDDQGTLSQESIIGFEEGSENEAHGLVVLEDGTVLIAGVDAIPAPGIDATDDPSNPVEVTLTQSAGDTIWYTTDGSDPRASATRQVYTLAFTVTGSVTVQAVAERDGVFSPVVSQEIEAGEALVPFAIDSISVSGTTVTLVQEISTPGYTYGLEYTQNLAADSQVWESVSTQPGSGDPLTWVITPIPASPRFWRVVIVEDVP